jgi:hypothetical protein
MYYKTGYNIWPFGKFRFLWKGKFLKATGIKKKPVSYLTYLILDLDFCKDYSAGDIDIYDWSPVLDQNKDQGQYRYGADSQNVRPCAANLELLRGFFSYRYRAT